MLAVRELLYKGEALLKEAGITDYAIDARLLLEFVYQISRTDLLLHPDRQVEEDAYLSLIKKRALRIPLQHLTGETVFMGHTFFVSEDVLVPRQDTEILVEHVLKEMPGNAHILDMCTGSGCILISLLLAKQDATGSGVDFSDRALAIAKKNAEQYETLESRIDFLQSDLFKTVTGKYDLIVSNPPYIATGEIDGLSPEVKNHDPMMALDGGEDGLCFYRRIVEDAAHYLNEGGKIFFEIGYDQGEAVKELLIEHGYHDVTVYKDYAGLDRVVKGYK